MALNLLRNARLFISTIADTSTTNLAKTNAWEIPILGDFSFSQANETQDITVNEAGSAPVRGAARFNRALNPVDWSFTSYLRPYINASTAARSLERVLWHGLVSDNAGPAIAWATSPWTSSATSHALDLTDSDKHKFTDLYFYIKADTQWYRITKAQVNQAEIDFGIDTIGQITWSGFGALIEEISAPTFTSTVANSVREFSSPLVSYAAAVSTTGKEADYIIQKYTTLYITNTGLNNDSVTNTGWAIPITGGTLTINNNMSYLTPENLGSVNKPYAAITGSRDISGSLSCYLKTGSTTDSGNLLKELLTSTSITQNTYELSFRAGGNSAPYVNFQLNECMLSVPVVDVQDVLSLNIDYKAMPYNEASITMVAGSDTTVSGKVYEIVTLGDNNWTAIGTSTVNATALVAGKKYIIVTVGGSTFPGAATNTIGTVFVATGAATGGTGTAYEAIFKRNSTALTGTTGTVKQRTMQIEGQTSAGFTAGPNDLKITYYPSTTTSDATDTN